jgi:hypothetical protein
MADREIDYLGEARLLFEVAGFALVVTIIMQLLGYIGAGTLSFFAAMMFLYILIIKPVALCLVRLGRKTSVDTAVLPAANGN